MNAKSSKKGRFIGWQETPIHQATFGGSTKSGSQNLKAKILHATGPENEVTKMWYLLDAAEAPVGRLATVAASLLMGKHRPTFTPGAGSGDFVVVINADKAFFTSNKADKKYYYKHTGWPGGLKVEVAADALRKHPEKVLWDAVYGMLPKTNLSAKQLKHLRIFNGTDHSATAQKPTKIDLKSNSLKSIPIGKAA